MGNNSFREIAEAIKANQSFALYPHTNMDGDAIGSSAAICLGRHGILRGFRSTRQNR